MRAGRLGRATARPARWGKLPDGGPSTDLVTDG
jgi:hypothetical protein